MSLRIAMLGDIVGRAGRQVVEQQLPELRRRWQPDLIIANAENISGGSGISPQSYRKLLHYGIDGITLGDHVYRQPDILPVLQTASNIIRPANLPASAAGSRWMKLTPHAADKPPLFVVTLLGRLYITNPLADDPFACIDAVLRDLPGPHPFVMVEVHAETTSEKMALGHYLDGRVCAVVGTHTHVPTADAKILPHGTAYMTDLGMCGPYDSILGRRKDRVLHHMTTGMMSRFDVADGDPRMCGAFIELDDRGRAVAIERIELCADMDRAPFSQ